MCHGQVVLRCSDHDHLLRCGQTVAPRYRVLKAFQCIIIFDSGDLMFQSNEDSLFVLLNYRHRKVRVNGAYVI